MSDSTAAITKLVPGFDFLQGLVKNAGSALPNIGQWVAPTLDPEVLEKRIDELRTVQFWLEQNTKMLGATIQALEVQRMTLSTLKTMNVQISDLRESMTLPERSSPAAPADQAPRKRGAGKPAVATTTAPTAPTAPTGMVDPMQWWGALTKQFTQLAAGAMRDDAGDAATSFAGTMVKQSFEAAEQAMKTTAPTKAAGRAAASTKRRKTARR